MTPTEFVLSRHTLPFALYPFQVEAVDNLAPLPRSALWFDMGTGKTIVSIVMALYKLGTDQVDRVVVLMPPILLTNWSRTLGDISDVTHTVYRGTPRQRAGLKFDSMFTIMGYQVFCKDQSRLWGGFNQDRTLLICDESTMAKNVATLTYKSIRDWCATGQVLLLSGSPLSSPADGYAPIKLVTPSVYRTLHMFEQIHVAARDFFDKPTEWANLDLLHSNLLLNASRVLKTDVIKDMPPITYTPVLYEMDPVHYSTYRRICDEQILKLEDGNKLDFTNASAMFHAMQQIPMNREYFLDEPKQAAGVDLIEETLAELGTGKLVIFTAYRITNRMLLNRLSEYGAVAVYGEVSAAKQVEAIDMFVGDPTCRVILLQIRSGGYGIDRLQTVCSTVVFAEMPLVPAHFHQAVARVWRVGQHDPVTVRVFIAERSIQVRLWDVLQDKDTLVNVCIRGFEDLRLALAGSQTVTECAV